MPRHEPRPLPPLEELAQALREAGVETLPPEGPADDLQGLLFLALHVAELRKTVTFDEYSPEDPGFAAKDDLVRVDVRYARIDGASEADLLALLRDNLPRMGRGDVSILALDCRASSVREFELGHHLFGEITLASWPHKPSESSDARIHAALDAGWAKTLKAHNLVPGRGIVVLDEHHGLLLREPELAALQGVFLLLSSGEVLLWWNPVSPGLKPEMQYWLTWGQGMPASAWGEVMRYEGQPDDD